MWASHPRFFHPVSSSCEYGRVVDTNDGWAYLPVKATERVTREVRYGPGMRSPGNDAVAGMWLAAGQAGHLVDESGQVRKQSPCKGL